MTSVIGNSINRKFQTVSGVFAFRETETKIYHLYSNVTNVSWIESENICHQNNLFLFTKQIFGEEDIFSNVLNNIMQIGIRATFVGLRTLKVISHFT